MNWGALIQTVLPTIGTVVGSLLKANTIEDGVVSFSFNNIEGANNEFQSTFYKENDKYYLFNQSAKSSDIVSLSFPARGSIDAETVMVSGRKSFDVTNAFAENAAVDSSEFEISGCSASQQTASNQEAGIKISCSGREIPVGGQRQSIGSYLEVEVGKQAVIVYPKGGVSLVNLPMVTVQSGGDTGVRLIDIQSEPQQAKVSLPQPLTEGDRVRVEVLANVSSTSVKALLDLQKNDSRFSIPSDEVVERIRKAPKLNWR